VSLLANGDERPFDISATCMIELIEFENKREIINTLMQNFVLLFSQIRRPDGSQAQYISFHQMSDNAASSCV